MASASTCAQRARVNGGSDGAAAASCCIEPNHQGGHFQGWLGCDISSWLGSLTMVVVSLPRWCSSLFGRSNRQLFWAGVEILERWTVTYGALAFIAAVGGEIFEYL